MSRIIILIIVTFTTSTVGASDQWVIRAHQNTLKSHGISVKNIGHGYGVIDERNKSAIDQLDVHAKHHWQIMPLTAFKPITASSAKQRAKDPAITELLDLLDSDRWLNDVTTLTSWNRITGSLDNNQAKDWIANRMSSLNLTVSTPAFTVNNQTTHNIMGTQLGQSRPNDWYVVGAHMDSIPSSGAAPGAVDNASGCAAVLEIARVASMFTFEGSLLFICYSGEEQGLHGSTHHVNNMTATERNEIKAIFTMDMIGYKNGQEHKLLLETSQAQQHIMQHLEQMAATYAPEMAVFTSYNPFGSDHMPYINNNMPAILSIDDDWNQYDDYHRSTDLPENLNNTQALYIIKTNLAALASMAISFSDDIIFANGFEPQP